MGARKRHPASRERPRRYQSGAIPIDDRVRLGEALTRALECLGVGVAIVDTTAMRFVAANAAFASLVGRTEDDLVLMPLREGFALQDADEAERVLASGRAAIVVPLRLRLRHATGQPVDVELSAHPFGDDAREGCTAVVVREAIPRHSRHPTSEAAAVAERDEVFSIAAHELKTPLTSLRLHAQTMQRGLQREPLDLARARRSIDEVERHAERMSLLVDQLLDVARIRGGRLEIERAPADLATIVRDVAARFGAEVASRGATIIIDGERSIPGHWDPLRLDQIVTNLVSNALKYGENNPIVLELRASHARARLVVRDYGGGIPAGDRERLFGAFERGSAKDGTRGSGLGLWIVRRLVEAHGGEIAVTSIVGRGTAFTVDLPRHGR